ncbi:MAG TPA: endonuclease/exonuclease/phosphatase family protein [Acidimicrobiales bacterium]|nr:endonuclease/exonuclease/phosphatase family protein [Acidimicrobiales bacterium]
MIIGAFNVENLFDRAKVLNQETWEQGAPVLAAHAELSELLERDPYSADDKRRILELLELLGILWQDEGDFVWLRRIRGPLVRRPRDRTKPVEVVATGRTSWIGWVDLKTEHVDALAMEHTAMVMRDVAADVLGVVEAEARPVLDMFTAAMLKKVGGTPYEQVMLVDGNDRRGIDVGLLSRYPIAAVRPHIYDADDVGTVFSRDCCEYHLDVGGGRTLVVLVNHLKSKGYGSPGDPTGAKRRRRQAARIAAIYDELITAGHALVAVVGDLNDTPDSHALQPLRETTLEDISKHPQFDPGPRTGTFRGEKNQIDYLLLSPDLFARATGGGIFRKGVWRGDRTRNPWEIYPTLTEERHAASDHAAIWAEIDL